MHAIHGWTDPLQHLVRDKLAEWSADLIGRPTDAGPDIARRDASRRVVLLAQERDDALAGRYCAAFAWARLPHLGGSGCAVDYARAVRLRSECICGLADALENLVLHQHVHHRDNAAPAQT